MLRHAVGNLFIALIFFLQASVSSAQEVKLYVFSMPGCMPCQQMAPDVERLKNNGYPVTKIDGVANPTWAQRFQVHRYPTVILVANNRVHARVTGAQNYANLKHLFDSINFQPGAVKNVSNKEIPTSNTSASSPSYRTSSLTPTQLAHHATVRIKVADPGGVSYATGTVIHQHGVEALVITCGHVFRDSHGKGKISVEYGFAENNVKTGPGALIGYDADMRDIGLVVFKADRQIKPAVVAPVRLRVDKGDTAFSYGCDHGDDPSLRTTRIKRRVVYNGAQKYDIVGRPVDGRSGGGLFSSGGQLIGVCNAAAVDVDEGVYTALENIYWQLEKVKLGHLFESNIADKARATQNQQIHGLTSNDRVSNNQPETNPRNLAANESNSNWTDNPRMEQGESQRTVSQASNDDDVEVVITVRSKSDPRQARSFTVHQPNENLIGMLNSLENNGSGARSSVATKRTNFPQPTGRIPESQSYRAQSPR